MVERVPGLPPIYKLLNKREMTGLNVVEVNIHIQGVNIEHEKREVPEETQKAR